MLSLRIKFVLSVYSYTDYYLNFVLMRHLYDYIYHYLMSNSRHGTHSPFVYALADQVIYRKDFVRKGEVAVPANIPAHQKELIKNILSFWGIAKLGDDWNDVEAEAYWLEKLPVQDEALLEVLTSGKPLFVKNPYSRQNRALWRRMLQKKEVTVSINLFHFGILLYRPVQHKEDFLLRQV